ncbi:MAG: M48 family metalloprotease [Parcubacteria group bacterium]|nr:M48 family metalloprotease [Parcubacteria group bacterium]
MYELIARNKRRSWLLLFSFSVLVLGLGYLISRVVEGGEIIFAIAFAVNVISILIGYYAGDSIVLASVKAVPLTQAQDLDLFRTVENLAITAGIPMPRVYLIADPALNAFATGRDPQHASVAITTGLRQLLTKPELEAVMGHELSHIKNLDIRVMLLAAVLFGMVVLLADLLWRLVFFGRGDRDRNSGTVYLIPVIIAAAILAPLAAQAIKLAISRRREFLADADSVMLTRYPEALVSALQKISQAPTLAGHHEATAHLFIYPPLKTGFLAKLFSTHPPLADRIEAIQKAARLHS